MKRKQIKLDSFFKPSSTNEQDDASESDRANQKRKLKLNVAIVLRLAAKRNETNEIIVYNISECPIPEAASVIPIASFDSPSSSTATTEKTGSDCVSASVKLTTSAKTITTASTTDAACSFPTININLDIETDSGYFLSSESYFY